MFKEYLDHFENEIYQATAFYVIWKNLQNEPAKDEALLKALNENALTWVFIRHSMMVSLIMALGRIFDTDGDAVSIDDLIKCCISEIDIFSKENLRKRKMLNHNANEWIDEYMKKVYEPGEQDFQRLKPSIKKYRNIYEKYYKPLRHKIFAHADKEYHLQQDILWQATKEANIEELLDFLEDFKLSIRESYLNGRKPELESRKIDENWFAEDILSLLNRVKHA